MDFRRGALRIAAVVSLAVLVGLIAGLAAGSDAPMRWILLPPVAAAASVLAIAALAVDYFGLWRRSHGWRGIPVDPKVREATSVRCRALEIRFDACRKAGDSRTPTVARALLLALAEADRLAHAGAVVDFLSADAVFTRVGGDVVADSLRAMALAELGRLPDAQALAQELAAQRPRALIVDYARACVESHGASPAAAIERIDAALASRRSRGLRRELRELRARALSRCGRHTEAAATLRELATEGHRHAVEQLLDRARDRGESALAQAALSALNQASPYR